MTASTSNLPFNSEDNRFYEKTINVYLNKQNIIDYALIKYNYGVNEDPIFKVFDATKSLLQGVNEYIKDTNNVNIPFVVVFYNSNHWSTLMICKTKMVAFYIDHYNTLIPSILKEQLKLAEIILYGSKSSRSVNYEYYESGIIAMETAVTLYDKKDQLLFRNTEEVFNDIMLCNPSNIIEKRQILDKYIQIIQMQRAKLNTLSINLTKMLNEINNDKTVDFNYSNANVFLQFITTFALQDHDMKLIDPEYKKYLENIIGKDDIYCVANIRNIVLHYYFHRNMRNSECNIVKPDHLKLLINSDMSENVNDLFQKITKYVNYILSITQGTYVDGKQIIRPNQHLIKEKLKIGIDAEQDGDEYNKELDNQLEKFFSKACSSPSYSNNILTNEEEQQYIFDLIVNFPPYFDFAFNKGKQTLMDMRNTQINRFYKYNDERFAIKYALTNYMRENKNCLFKCCYSRYVYPLLRDLNETLEKEKNSKDDIENMKKKLCDSLETFLNIHDTKVLPQQRVQNQDSCADSLNKDHANSLETFECKKEPLNENTDKIKEDVEVFFKFLLFITNNGNIDEIDFDGEEKTNQQRYKNLEVEQIMKIKTDMENLQRLKHSTQPGCENHYETIKKSLQQQFEKDYGIMKEDFDSIATVTINWNDIEVDNYNNYIDHISKQIKIINKLQREYKCSDKYISNIYRKRRKLTFNKASLEHLISTLPLTEHWDVNILFKNSVPLRKVVRQVNPDRFVAMIYEIIYNESQKPISNDINDIFNDSDFLDYLGKYDVFFPNLMKEYVDFMIPLYARIISLANYSITNENIELCNQIIKKLVDEDNFIIHLKPIIRKVHENEKYKIHFFDEICKYILEKYNKSNNIYFLNKILDDADIADDVIGVIRKKDNKITINILETIVDKSFVIAFHDVKKALDLLTTKNIHDAVDNLKNGNLSEELYLYWKAKYSIAHLNSKIGNRKVCYEILEDITLNTRTTDEVKPYYFLSLSHMADLRNKEGHYEKAYNSFCALYNEFVTHILGAIPTEFNTNVYNNVIQNDRYKYAQKLSPRYLDIIRIRCDIAYSQIKKNSNNNMKEQSYKDSLKIYEENHKIQSEVLENTHKNIIGTKRNISFVSYNLGIEMIQKYRINEANYYYNQALTYNKEVYELLKEIYWDTHPIVKNTFKSILNTYRNILKINSGVIEECKFFINNNLANIKAGSTEKEIKDLDRIIYQIEKYNI